MKRMLIILMLLGAGLVPVMGQPTEPGLYLDQSLQGEINPLGAKLESRLYYRLPLIKSDKLLWESTKIDLGIQNDLTPAYDFAGVYIDIAPIAVLDLALTAQVAGYYKAFGFGFYGLSGPDAGYNSSSLQALQAQNATGYVLSATPTLKAAFGPIVVLDSGTINYFKVSESLAYFYERSYDTVLSNPGTELANQAYLLARVHPDILAGINDYLLYVPKTGYLSHRISGIVIYSGRLSSRVSPYGALVVGTYLADRYEVDALYLAAQVGATLHL